MNNPITLEWDEPWRETETFLRLLRGPRFAAPPTDEHGIAIGGYCTTINREPFLRDHPKMRVDLSDPDDGCGHSFGPTRIFRALLYWRKGWGRARILSW